MRRGFHRVSLSFLALVGLVFVSGTLHATSDKISKSQVQEGFRISPIPKNMLNMHRKNPDLVGLGSYLVNGVGDCSGCHSFPQYLDNAGDPFAGAAQDKTHITSADYNTTHYLAGGQCFGPFMARNITPDISTGLPAGLTLADFMTAIRTGKDVECANDPTDPFCSIGPPTSVLQVMPWPTFHNMTDRDLKAIYTYLSALPHAEPCNTPADGCPAPGGSYAYTSTPDCPNPAPPQ